MNLLFALLIIAGFFFILYAWAEEKVKARKKNSLDSSRSNTNKSYRHPHQIDVEFTENYDQDDYHY